MCTEYRKIPLISPGHILCRASKTGRIFGHGLILGHGRYFRAWALFPTQSTESTEDEFISNPLVSVNRHSY